MLKLLLRCQLSNAQEELLLRNETSPVDQKMIRRWALRRQSPEHLRLQDKHPQRSQPQSRRKAKQPKVRNPRLPRCSSATDMML
ncbi:hypothetical protein IGI04_037606 [Brassica rapa subsp. trilocularis]|uniref:Uncharacterized protein n=1 Tax=Brassica rapa subsp. trilocularis TaxID=1813537 RepID=A0ABQ7LLR2_BRACM|nr:hypothetical protein IGI04_037606 [Brassica rapa subsp. trilocularis]